MNKTHSTTTHPGARRLRTVLTWVALAASLPVPIQATAQCAPSAQQAPQSATPALVRGVWVASPDHNRFFDSPASMQEQMRVWRQQGINTLFVAMWNQGRTMYPSAVVSAVTGVSIDARFQGRDPLQEVIDVARQEGLKVYAWFEFGFATDYQGGLGSELLEKRPQWAARDQHGKHVIKNGFRWMNALDPDVQDFVVNLVTEVVDRYDVDGVQGDDRLPAIPSEGGYDAGTVARYRKAHAGAVPPRNSKDPEWLQWRANELNQFVQRLHGEVKRRKPSVQISMSPSPFPWGRDEYLQDWPTWLRNGWVDSVSPQIYRYNLAAYKTELHKISHEQVCPAQLQQVFPGILLSLGSEYVAPAELLKAQIQANRAEGIQGEVFFHSEGLRKRADYFGADYRATWRH